MRLLGITLGIAATVACLPGEDGDNLKSLGDDDAQSQPLSLDDHVEECRDNRWVFQLTTQGWVESATLAILDTKNLDWDEQHDMPSVVRDDYGDWDHLEIGPLAASSQDNWTANRTAFSCNATERMTFVARVYDEDGFADCAVWGHAPEVVLDGDGSRLHIKRAAEIRDGNCDVWAE